MQPAHRQRGRGAVLVGSHLGAHVAGLHWLYRRGVPLRLLVQRPGHVSGELNRRFDRIDDPHPQSGFFLRRDMATGQCVERLVRTRAALRDGLAVYLNGDIPWPGPNTRPGRLLGQHRRFLSVWTDLAALTRAPVFLIFCTHRPGGRYALTIDPPTDRGRRGRDGGPSGRSTSRASSPRSPPTRPTPSPTCSKGAMAPAALAVAVARPGRRVAAVLPGAASPGARGTEAV